MDFNKKIITAFYVFLFVSFCFLPVIEVSAQAYNTNPPYQIYDSGVGGGSGGSGGSPFGGGSPSKCPGGNLQDPLCGKTIFEILNKVIGYLIKIGAPIVAIMVIYGGFLILTAGDKPEQVTNGKNTILYAAIGYAIIICSWGIIYIIGEILGAKLK